MCEFNKVFLRKFSEVNSIYDFFALIIRYLLIRNKRSSDFSKEEENALKKEKDEIDVLVKAFFDRVENITDKRRLQKLRDEMEQFLGQYVHNDRQFCILCMDLVRAIDDNLKVPKWKAGFIESSGCSDYLEYEFLNKNYADKVGLLPNMTDSFMDNIAKAYTKEQEPPLFIEGIERKRSLFREKKDKPDLCISDLVHNFLVFNQEVNPLASCRTYYFPRGCFIGDHFSELEQLKIGIAPLLFHDIKNICNIEWKKPTQHGAYGAFTIDGFYERVEEELLNRYNAVVQEAREQKLDFLVFPELLVSPKFVEQLNSEGQLPLIINGSYWKNGQNCCYISDATSHIIGTYFKKIAFMFEENGIKYREGLKKEFPEKQYILMDFEGFARIGVCICKDLDDSNQRMFHKQVQENILFVPSFSGSTDMQDAAKELSGSHQMLVVVANSCSALWQKGKSIEDYCREHKIIGYVTVPGKRKTQRVGVLHNYCIDGTICNKCEDANISCCNVVTIDTKNYVDSNGLLTLRVCQSFPSGEETAFGEECGSV